MSAALERIRGDFRDFSDLLARCRSSPFNGANVKDTYNRLNRVRARYEYEKNNHALDPIELQALSKVFEDDVFMKGMLGVGRQIAEHVKKRSGGEVVLYTSNNYPVPLPVETSAGAFFANYVYKVIDTQGGHVTFVNHLDQLEGARRRIESALARALTPDIDWKTN